MFEWEVNGPTNERIVGADLKYTLRVVDHSVRETLFPDFYFEYLYRAISNDFLELSTVKPPCLSYADQARWVFNSLIALTKKAKEIQVSKLKSEADGFAFYVELRMQTSRTLKQTQALLKLRSQAHKFTAHPTKSRGSS